MDETKLNEEVLSEEIAKELKNITKSVLDELLPKEKAVEDKPAIDLNDYIKKEDVEKAIEERLEDRKKAGAIKKALYEPVYDVKGAYTDTSERDRQWAVVNKAKEHWGLKTESEMFNKSYAPIDQGAIARDSKIKIDTPAQKAGMFMAYKQLEAMYEGNVMEAKRISEEFADPVSLKNKTLMAGSGSGSYTVPVDYEALLTARRAETFPILEVLAHKETTTKTGNAPYGISDPKSYMGQEGVDVQVSQPVWGSHSYEVKEQYNTVIVTDDLTMYSELDVMSEILNAQGRSLGAHMNELFITGTGKTSLPYGLENISVIATQSIFAGASGAGKGLPSFMLASVACINLGKMIRAGLPYPYHKDAVLCMHSDTAGRIWDATGPYGQPLFNNEIMVNGRKTTIKGFKVYENNNVQTCTDTKTAALAQIFFFVPSYYRIVTMKGYTVKMWDQATIGGVNLAAARCKALFINSYWTAFSTSPYAFSRWNGFGDTRVPV